MDRYIFVDYVTCVIFININYYEYTSDYLKLWPLIGQPTSEICDNHLMRNAALKFKMAARFAEVSQEQIDKIKQESIPKKSDKILGL